MVDADAENISCMATIKELTGHTPSGFLIALVKNLFSHLTTSPERLLSAEQLA